MTYFDKGIGVSQIVNYHTDLLIHHLISQTAVPVRIMPT